MKTHTRNTSEDTRVLVNSNRHSEISNDENARHINAPGVDNVENLHTSSQSSNGYQELFGDFVPCPSCRGLGRVPKEQENQLVALIPMKDGRLKPRRTTLYVIIAVSICVITASLLIFFLMPRNIRISSNRPLLNPLFVDINVTKPYVNFTVKNHYNVSNDNFYTVKISDVKMNALFNDKVVATAHAFQTASLPVSARSTKELYILIDFLFIDEYGNLALECRSEYNWDHNLPIVFEVTANYAYMGHTEQTTLTTFQFVSCYPPVTTTTPKVTTTSTTTTTTSAKPTTTGMTQYQQNKLVNHSPKIQRNLLQPRT